MIKLFFRLTRKWQLTYAAARLRMKLRSYHHMSGKRFLIHPSLQAGKGFSVQTDLSETTIHIGEQVRVRNDFYITMGHKGHLRIGDHCFFNHRCSISCLGSVEIGSNNQFGENVLMYDHNHIYGDPSKLISAQGYTIGKIKIGNDCWFGSNVVILKDVEIGDNVVIGAGCVVYKSVATGTVIINRQENLVLPR